MTKVKKRLIMGWFTVGLSTIITSIWAFWGIIENFHEGWYYESLPSNLGLMFAQYLSPMLVFMSVTLISIHWPRLGGGLHVFLGGLMVWFFGGFSNPGAFLIIVPLIGIGSLYWFGRPKPRNLAALVIVGFPLLTLIISGIEPVIRVSNRINDGNLQTRLVHGNGVELLWAPDGPGWPRAGTSWDEAQHACRHLSEGGLTLTSAPVNMWRLPTVDEAVRSMARHGTNSGGQWDEESAKTTYITTPDKESPLWNIYSQVIYWWTATEVGDEHAYIIAYDGMVWTRDKQFGPAYLGYRCVKLP